MGVAARRGASGAPDRAGRVGPRTFALVALATMVPVATMLWASVVAQTEVEQRALDGLTATARATVLQEQQAWDDAVRVAVTAASRPVPLSAVDSHDAQLATQGMANILASGPFDAVRLYDAGGALVAVAARSGTTPVAATGLTAGPVTFGGTVINGSQISRQVSVAAGAADVPKLGRLVVDVDVTQLLGKPDGLAFGRTGVKVLVTRAGMVVAGSTSVGQPLRAITNLAMVAAGRPATAVLFSPLYQRVNVESYEPIPGQDMGILLAQDRAEVMAGADRLVGRLRWVAGAVCVLGGLLAVGLGLLLGRRSRRLVAIEQRLAATEAESRRRLEQFLDAMPIGVFVATPEGRPHYANREADRLLGRGVVPGAGPGQLAEVYQAYVAGTDDLYPAERMPLLQALAGTTSHVDDMEIHGEDGTVPVEVWGTPIRAADGTIEFGITAFGDVSDRRRAADVEIAARRLTHEAQEALASIVLASRDAILAKSLDGTVTSWNPGAEAVFGYTAAEMVGSPIEVLIPPEGRDEESGLRAHVAAGHGVEQYETVRLRKDGTTVNVSTTLSPIRDAAGEIVGIATICRDISERKRAEAALREREELLAAARDEAMEASRLKSQFLSNTSHEIRTPMTVIMGMNELLLDTDLDATQRRFAEAASRSCAALLAIVSDILDFSKIEAGHLDLEVSEIDLPRLIGEIGTGLADVAAAKGLEVTCWWPPDLPAVVRGDAARVRQVLLNLASNAVKFTDTGQIEMRATWRRGISGPTVRFDIRDSGIGIAADDQPLLFQPFSQIDGSDTRSYGGTGLGLAICRQLVDAMGGRLGVESTAGSGSTFWFEVPFGPADAPTEAGGRPPLHWPGARGSTNGEPEVQRRLLVRERAEVQALPQAVAGTGARRSPEPGPART